jgi:hypothetical protein
LLFQINDPVPRPQRVRPPMTSYTEKGQSSDDEDDDADDDSESEESEESGSDSSEDDGKVAACTPRQKTPARQRAQPVPRRPAPSAAAPVAGSESDDEDEALGKPWKDSQRQIAVRFPLRFINE